MNRTKIEWTNFSWNPIRGLCPVNCKLPDGRSYCYARRMYQRFKLYPEKRFSLLECAKPLHLRRPSRIFVCSTFELFHPIITERQRELIFRVIKKCPQHIFQILTKFPQNIDREMPDNVWLGVSITKPSEMKRWTNLYFHQRANLKFVSFEPLLERLDCYPSGPDWIIVGRLTGYGHKCDPDISWIKDIVKDCANQGVKVFLKDNLKDIWGGKLIQEFPE